MKRFRALKYIAVAVLIAVASGGAWGTTYTWNLNTNDQDWSKPANWYDGSAYGTGTPGSTDIVIIDATTNGTPSFGIPGQVGTLTINTSWNTGTLATVSNSITITSGTLTLGTNLTSGAITNSGTIDTGTYTLDISGASSGLTGGTIANGGSITLGGRTLSFDSYSGSGSITTTNGIIAQTSTTPNSISTLTVTSGVTINADSTGGITVSSAIAGDLSSSGKVTVTGTITGAIINSGTLTANGTAITTINNSGSLTLNGPITTTGLATNPSGTIDTGTYTLDISGASSGLTGGTIANGGSITLGGRTLSFDSYSGSGSITTTNGVIAQTSTTPNSISTLTVTSGVTINADSTGGITVSSAIAGDLSSSGKVTVTGTITGAIINSGTLTANGTAITTINNSGSLTLNGPITATAITCTGTIDVNSKTLTAASVTSGANSITFATTGTFTGTGTINGATNLVVAPNVTGNITTAGTVTITGTVTGAIINSGTLTANGTAITTINNSGSLTLNGPITATGLVTNTSGTINIGLNTFTASVTGITDGAITLSTGSFIAKGSVASVTTTGSASVNGSTTGLTITALTATGTLSTSGTITTKGSASAISNTGAITLSGALAATAITCTGTIDVNSQTLTAASVTSGANSITFATTGTFTGTGTINGATNLVVAPNVTGNITTAGTVTITGTVTGAIINSGTLTANGTAITTINNSGSLTLNGPITATAITCTGTIDVNSQTLTATSVTSGANSITFATTGTFTGTGTINGATNLVVAPNVTGNITTAGTVTITGTVTGAIINSGTLTANGTAITTINNSGSLTLNGPITATGLVTNPSGTIDTGTYTLDISGASSGLTGGTIANGSSITLGGRTLSFDSYSGSGSITTTNGVIAQTSTTPNSISTLTVTSGVTINADSTGGITVSSAIAGDLSSSGKVTVTGTITGAIINSGTLTANGTTITTINNSGSLTLNGPITATGLVTNTSGTINIGLNTFTASVTGITDGAITLSTGSFIAKGSVASVTTTGSASVNGSTTGLTITALTATGTLSTSGTITTKGSASAISNTGAITLSGALTATAITCTGTIDVNSQTLTAASVTSGTNSITFATTGTFTGTGTINGATNLVVAPNVTGNITTAGTVTITGTVTGAIINSGTLTANGTAITTINNSGSLTLNGPITATAITCTGTIDVNSQTLTAASVTSGANSITFATTGTFTGTGTINGATNLVVAPNVTGNITTAGTVTITGTVTGAIINSGTLTANGTAITTINNSGSLTLNGPITATGLVTNTGGTINIGSDTFTASTTGITGGAVTLSTGSFSAKGSVASVTTTGSASVNGSTTGLTITALTAAGTLSTSGSITTKGSASAITNTGTINLNGNLTATGLVTNTGGTINIGSDTFTANTASISGGGVNIGAGGSFSTSGTLTLDTGGSVTASGTGTITSGTTLTLNDSSIISSVSGTITAGGLVLNGTGTASTSGTGAITITTGGVTINSSGGISLTGSGALGVTGNVAWGATGSGNISVTSGGMSVAGNLVWDASASGALTVSGGGLSLTGSSSIMQASTTNGNINIAGNLTFAGNLINYKTLNVTNGNISATGGASTYTNYGTITTAGSGTQTWAGSMANSGTITGIGLITFASYTTGASGLRTLNIGTGGLLVTGTADFTNGSVIGSTGGNPNWDFKGALICTGSTITQNGDFILFSGAANQSFTTGGVTTYGTIIVNKTNTVTMSGTATIATLTQTAGNITTGGSISVGTLTMTAGTFTLSSTDTLTLTATPALNGGTLELNGALAAAGVTFTIAGTTVNAYTSAFVTGAMNVNSGSFTQDGVNAAANTVASLTVGGAGTCTWDSSASGGTLTINGDLTNSGTLAFNYKQVTVGGTCNLGGNVILYDLIIYSGKTLTPASGATITVRRNMTIQSGGNYNYLIANNPTLVLGGASSVTGGIYTDSNATAVNLGTVTVSGSFTKTLATHIKTGVLTLNTTLDLATFDFTSTGNVSGSGTIIMSGTNAQNVDFGGDVSVSTLTATTASSLISIAGSMSTPVANFSCGSTTVTFTGSTATTCLGYTFGTLVMNKSASTDTFTTNGNITVNTLFTMTQGDFRPSTYSHTIAGNWDSSASSVLFNTPGSSTITLSSGTTSITTKPADRFNNLVIAGNGTLAGNITTNADFTSWGTLTGAHALTIGGMAKFHSTIGVSQSLTSIGVAGTTTTYASTTAIKTTATQTYGDTTGTDTVTLGDDTAFTGSTVTFSSNLDAATHFVTILGNAQFGDATGTDTVSGLTTLTVSGQTSIYATTITSSGTQTYTGPVTLNADPAISTMNASITFGNTIAGSGHALDLTAGAGNIILTGDVGGSATKLGAITVHSAANVAGNAGGTNPTGAIYAASLSQATGTGLTYLGAITTDGTLGVSLTTNDIHLAAAVQTTGGGLVTLAATTGTPPTPSLTIDAAGAINSDGAVTLTGTNGISTAGNITTTSDTITINSVTTLTGDVALATSGANISLLEGITRDGTARSLDVSAGTGSFIVPSTKTLGTARLNAITIHSATNVAGDSGATSDAGPIYAASLTQSGGSGTSRFGTIDTTGAVSIASATIRFFGTVSSSSSSITVIPSSLFLSGAAGTINAATTFAQTGTGISQLAANITAPSGINFDSTVYLYTQSGEPSMALNSSTNSTTFSGDIHIAAPGKTLTFSSPVHISGNCALYAGIISLTSTYNVDKDLVMLNGDPSTMYDDDKFSDRNKSTIAGLFSYIHAGREAAPNLAALAAAFPDGAPAFPATYSGAVDPSTLDGKTITVGKNFYDNGVNLTPPIHLLPSWTLSLTMDNGNATAGFAEAYNCTIYDCNVTGAGYLSAAEKVTMAGPDCEGNFDTTRPYLLEPSGHAVNNGTFYADNKDVPTNGDLSGTYTVYDDVIRVEFYDGSTGTLLSTNRKKIENSHNEISAALNAIKFSSGACPFTGAFTDASCTNGTDGAEDLYVFYLRTDPSGDPAVQRWNTDAYGTSLGATDNNSTDRGRIALAPYTADIPRHRTAVPNIDIPKALSTLYETLRDNHKNRIASYHPATSGTFFTAVADRCRPVLIKVIAGQELHVTNPKTNPANYFPWDAHNYFELVWSEPVNIGGLTDTSWNVRSTHAFSTEPGGETTISGGLLTGITGYFGISSSDISLSLGVRTGISGITDPADVNNQATANGLYRRFALTSTQADLDGGNYAETALPSQRYRLRIYVAGYGYDISGTYANSQYSWKWFWPGYIDADSTGKITDPATSTATIQSVMNANILDRSGGHANAIEPYESWTCDGTTALSNAYGPTSTYYNKASITIESATQPWDTKAPDIAQYSVFDPSKWAKDESSYFEMCPIDANGDGYVDRIEFHMFDDMPSYDSGDKYKWVSRRGWFPSSYTTASTTATYAVPDTRARSTAKADTMLGGIRAASMLASVSATTATMTAGAFSINSTSLDNTRLFGTGVTDSLLNPSGSINVLEDPYFCLFTAHTPFVAATDQIWRVTDSLTVSYNKTAGFITDLAGIRLPSFTNRKCIDRTSPKMTFTIQPLGDKTLYIVFSKPVSLANLQTALKVLDGSGANIVDTSVAAVSTQSAADIAAGYSKDAIIKLNRAVTLSELMTMTVMPVGITIIDPETSIALNVSNISDAMGNRMAQTDSHRITDLGINVVNPLYASDGVNTDGTFGEGEGALRTFDGTGRLLDRDITIASKINAGTTAATATPETLQLYFDVNPSDSLYPTVYNDWLGKSLKLWLPSILPSFNNSADLAARSLSPNTVSDDNKTLRNFIVPSNDDEIKTGAKVEFIFKYGDLYCARLADATDITSVDPWRFNISALKLQRGDVTILNNVIDSNKKETTLLNIVMEKSGSLVIQVFTMDGNVVRTIERGKKGAGTYTYSWNGTNLAGNAVARGIYFIRVIGPDIDEIRKVMVVKE